MAERAFIPKSTEPSVPRAVIKGHIARKMMYSFWLGYLNGSLGRADGLRARITVPSSSWNNLFFYLDSHYYFGDAKVHRCRCAFCTKGILALTRRSYHHGCIASTKLDGYKARNNG